ncbi:hypothetical protein GJAV_G00043250 [Gymnothorax javanicus]|nr:hypothetical protein GJAV_G00043250 [Gymnothorax javanicus]
MMELHLDVVLLTTIKRKKPWPRFCWLGLEKESVFLLDDNRISEINMVSGRTKRKIPKLHPLLQRALTTGVSQNGMWLAGLLVSGDVFLWSKDSGCLKMINTVPRVSQLVTAAHESSVRLSLLVSCCGQRLLLTALTGQVFLWECVDRQDLAGTRDGTVKGRWQQILPLETTALPSPQHKEASQHSVFSQGEAVGDCCLTVFVFTEEAQLKLSFLKIEWEESLKLSSVGYSVRWVTQAYPLPQLSPPCRPVRSRGALVPVFSPDGQLLAVALNQRDPKATQVLFISTQNFVTVSSWLGGCGSRNLSIPSKYVRSYWVACMSWAPGGLYLACVLKRGSLLLLARLGGLVSLSTSGCSVELGPAHFLPLHPLVTCRLPAPALARDVSPTSSCASSQDTLRQRYSVTWHPRLPYLIMSDGYMATVLRVPLQATAAALVSSLLQRCAEGLERVRNNLALTQPQVRTVLDSLPSLKLTAGFQELRKQDSALSTLPPFLRDESDTTDITQLHTGSQCAGEEYSDDEGSQFPGTRVGDRGRLEFASMFDTLHAYPDFHLDLNDPDDSEHAEEGTQPLLVELEDVQKSLLTAWALGLSMGGEMVGRGRLLRSAVRCALCMVRLLQVAPLRAKQRGGKLCPTQQSQIWPLIRNLYSLLPWDALRGEQGSCLGVSVDLTGQILQLFLSHLADLPQLGQPSRLPKTLSSALLFLRMASRCLDLTYSLPKGASSHTSDVFSVPFLKEGHENGASRRALQARQRPSSRLLELWRKLYAQTLQYQIVPPVGSPEQGQMSAILYQIQQVLQDHGDRLGGEPALHRVNGEEHFLSGSYAESARVWREELCTEKERGGARTFVLETRFCLALLYGHLFQYQLRQALSLCEHLARRLVPPSRMEEESLAESAEYTEQASDPCLLGTVGMETACAVVQSFGRFMAAYFSNQPLTILPPHNVGVLPPLHFPAEAAPGQRLVPVSRSAVLGEVRRQQLSEVWTVDYALELLLQGGLLPEAAWLAHSLGDWKTAVSLSLAYTSYCREQADFSRLKWRELCLPAQLLPRSIFQNQLQQLLGLEEGGEETELSGAGCRSYGHFADWVLEEDSELKGSVQEVLRASVMAQVDVLSQPLHALVEAAKDLASRLTGLVPPGVYLPAPPLYCPQPASDAQVSVGDVVLASDGRSRQCISAALQRALLLLSAANCSVPAAQWYITNLQQRQLLLHKKLGQSLIPFPEGLKEFVPSGAFFSAGTNGEAHLDSVAVEVIACFREVCGLCWMLHVRDQLSISCRKYQAARTQVALSQACDVSSNVVQCCMDALRWACRLIPFSRFLKAEEVLQDLVLSLVSELPPIPMVVDILAQVFPEEEESVQVSLREKYNAHLQKLRHCTIPASEQDSAELEGEAMVTVLIQKQLALRRRIHRKIAKLLAPPERHIWERIEDEDERSFDRFSPSRSTLSDSRCSPQSNDNRAVTPDDGPETPVSSLRRQSGQVRGDGCRPLERGSRGKEAVLGQMSSGALPPVGSWEFELSDEEYPRFLELFLSYVLERDCAENKDSALPLLCSSAPQLQEAELHSLAFDVLTTLKRRQRAQWSFSGERRGGTPSPDPRVLPQTPSSGSNPPLQSEAFYRSSATCIVPPSIPHTDKPLGLFGLRRQHQPMRVTQAEGAWTGSETGRSSTIWTPQADHKAQPPPPMLELAKPEARFHRLSRLLEWMIRWADKRVKVSHSAVKRSRASVTEGVVMRARASTPAVFNALRVLELRYTAALLAKDEHYFGVPEGEFSAAHVQPDMERTVRPECSASPESAINPPPLESLHGDVSEVSELEEVEPQADMGAALEQGSYEEALELENWPRETHPGSEDETDSSAAEIEGESRGEDPLYDGGSASCISVQIKTLASGHKPPHEQTLTLADLGSDRVEKEVNGSDPAVVETSDPDASLERDFQARPAPNRHPGPQLQGVPSDSTPDAGRSPDALPPSTSADAIRQLVHDQIFRLVQFQQMSFMSLLQTVTASLPTLPPMNQTQYPIPTDNILNQRQYPTLSANLPPINQIQNPVATDNLPQLNQTQYPLPTDMSLLNQRPYPTPSANLPPINQIQYPVPTNNLPLLNQTQYPIPSHNLPPLNQNQHPILSTNSPLLNQNRYPVPAANRPPLNISLYPVPTNNVPGLIQNEYPMPTRQQIQCPVPTDNLPQLNQTQNPIPSDNQPSLNQNHFNILTADLLPLNRNSYPVATDNLPQLIQNRHSISADSSPLLNLNNHPIPPANLTLLNQNQYPVPTGNPPPLNQNQYIVPTDDLPSLDQDQGAHQLSVERKVSVRLLLPSVKTPDEPELNRSGTPSSESECQSDMESMIEEVEDFPVRLEELRGTQAERESLLGNSPKRARNPRVHHQGVQLLRAAGSSQSSSSVIPPAHTGIKLLKLAPSSHSSVVPPPPVHYSCAVPPPPREAFVHPRTDASRDAPFTVREAGRDRPRPARGMLGIPRDLSGPDNLGKGAGRGVSLTLIHIPLSHRQAPPQGLPLLCLSPEPRLPAAPSRPPLSSPSPVLIPVAAHPAQPAHPGRPGLSSGIQLLQRDPDPPSKVLMGRTAWAPERRDGAAGGAALQLLTGVSQASPAHATLGSSKRQRRRDEKEQEGAVRGVARLEPSCSSPTELDKAEPSEAALEENLVISKESISSMLSGQDVVSRALSTAAELHAFASTHKRPPVLHDASTNTDSAPPAGDVQAEPAPAVCPAVLLNLQFPREQESANTVEQEPSVVTNSFPQQATGRHFINMINLEDEELLEHLPSCQISASPDRPITGAAVPSPPSLDPPIVLHKAAGTVPDSELEPHEKPSPAAALAIHAEEEEVEEEEEAGAELHCLIPEREAVGLSDSFGFRLGLRDVTEESYSSRAGLGGADDDFDATEERSAMSADEPLVLSDMTNTLAELVRGASTSFLGLSHTSTESLTRLGEQRKSAVEPERQELQAWMRKKQRKMLAEYRRQREKRREREHRPYTPSSPQVKRKNESTNKKMREIKGKTVLLEHHTQRAREACNLMTELLEPTPALPTVGKALPSPNTNQSSRRSKPGQSLNASKSNRRGVLHGLSDGRRGRRTQLHAFNSSGRTVGETHGRNLHRPGALPEARSIQWGMRDTRSTRGGKGWMKGLGPSLREGSGRRTRDLREKEGEEEESDEERSLSPWNPPLEIRKILGLEQKGDVEERNDSAVGGARLRPQSLDRDSLSESTGSILSKLDWTAIERMVAGEEDV